MNKIISIIGAIAVFALVAPVQAKVDENLLDAVELYYRLQERLNTAEDVSEPAEVEEDQLLGWSTKDEIWLNNDAGVIYFDTSKGSGIRVNSGIMQCKNSSGSWGACAGTTPGDNGWLANGINNAMYPGTNATGGIYPLFVGVTASSSPATANTELYVGGGGEIVATGNLIIGVSGTGADVTFYSDTTDETMLWDASANVLDIGGMATTSSATGNFQTAGTATVGVDGTGADFTAYSDTAGETMLWDASANLLDIGGMATTSSATGNFQTEGTLTVVGASTFTGDITGVNASTTLAQATKLFAGASGASLTLEAASITDESGAISFGNENLTTTGNFSAANITGSGVLAIDTDTLYANNSTDRVGVGTSTPFAYLAVDADGVSNSFYVGSSTADILTVKNTGVVHINDDGASYVDVVIEGDSITDLLVSNASLDRIGIGTSTPGYLMDVDGDFNVGIQGAATTTAIFHVNTTLSTGGVGIGGVTSPTAFLDINSDGATQALFIGSSTAAILDVKTTGVIHGNDDGTSYVDLVWEGDSVTNLFTIDASVDGVGLASTTPAFAAQLAIGEGGTASSTIAAGRFCMYAEQEDGTGVYIVLGANQANNQPFATTTTSCF